MRRSKRLAATVFAGLAGVGLAACADSTGPGPQATVQSAAVVQPDSAPHTRLHVALDEPSALQVTYWRAQDANALQVTSGDVRANHEVFLPRTYASSEYLFQVRPVSSRGRTGAAYSGSFTTGALPAEVAALQFTGTGEPSDSLAMIEMMINNTGFGGGVIIVDEAGRIVWYWKGQGGFLMGASRRANGNWVFHDAGRIVEVTPDRRAVAVLPNAGPATDYGTIHHDLVATPQNTVFFIANDARVYPDSTVVGEAIWEWFPEQNRTEKRWSAFDFMSWPEDRGPDSDKSNWMHMNSLVVGARGNVLFSSRSLDQVVSIAPDFGAVEWRLGGVNATIPATGDAHFSGQHNISEVAPNRILMWDNGRRRTIGEFSRGLELAVSPQTGSVTRVAEFRATPDRLQPIVGGAYRMANGNTLITYGWGGGDQINIYELAGETTTRWHLTAPGTVERIYKARTLPSIAGERRVPRP